MIYLLPHVLAQSAARYPDRDAVISAERRVTYRDLDAVSSRLAALLIERGFSRGDRAGIFLQKSVEAIVAVQAVLKAGGVYVPLDAKAPPSRLSYIIENCGIQCLLVSTATVARVPHMIPSGDRPTPLVVVMDDQLKAPGPAAFPMVTWQDVVARPDDELRSPPGIDTDLAYILYTSGSTGVPKGVAISHRTSLTFVDWAYDTFHLSPEDRVSSHAPLHFDLSIFDMFATFRAGGAMVLVPETLSMFPVRLADWIAHQRISIWYSVPSILSMLALHGRLDRHTFRELRTVLFAGEVFPTKYLRGLMAALPNAEFYNLYGPTETNVITYYKVPTLAADRTEPVPIGKPCANMDVFALTEEGQLVTGPGHVGELYARGSCLAAGYWGDAETTDRSFVTNPLQPHVRERVYRTGDLVALDENADFVFLGRRDHMVKSRGYRIELGDIENALYSHPAVREAVAVAVPDELLGSRIKAFVALTMPGTSTAEELQRHCATRVPSYMVPEGIEFRDALPKTSTGKVDRTALRHT